MHRTHLACAAILAAMLLTTAGRAADQYGLEEGTPDIQSADVVAFGPDGVLFVGDAKSAAIFAIQTGETSGNPDEAAFNVEGLNVKIAEALGGSSQNLQVRDLAVSPLTGNVFVAVQNGDSAGLVRISGDSEIEEFSLEDVSFAKAELPDPQEDKAVETRRGPRNMRNESITDLAYAETQLLVSGLNAESKSSVWTFAFPFSEFDAGSTLEIFHGAHGRSEDYAAMRTFVPFTIDGEPHLLASYVCTPLVKFPLSELESGERVTGTTVAELGNRNRPDDMIVYEKDGAEYLLMLNSNPLRGTQKISTEGIGENEGITERVEGGGQAGQSVERIDDLAGAVQLAKLNDEHAVVVFQEEGGPMNLRTVELP